MKQITVALPDDIYQFLSIRAAIDDLKPEQGAANILTYLCRNSTAYRAKDETTPLSARRAG